MPEKGYEGQVGLRYNTGSDEKLASAGVTAAIGDQFAIRLEGTKHKANNYIAPNYVHEHDGEFEKESSDAWVKHTVEELLPQGFKCPKCCCEQN